MQTIDIAVIEALVREGLPRATEDEVAYIVSRCENRTVHPDNMDLLRPFRPRDGERAKRERVETLVGCLLTRQRTGWWSNALNPLVRIMIQEAGAQSALPTD